MLVIHRTRDEEAERTTRRVGLDKVGFVSDAEVVKDFVEECKF